MSRSAEIATLLRKAGNASTSSEQQAFVRQATELQNEQHEASLHSGEWSAEDAVIRDTLVPGFTHELHTAATDWLVDLDDEVDPRQAHQAMIAEASLWYGRVNDEVKSYGGEYDEQARNLARRLAGQYGDYADQAERAFLDEAARLRTTAVKAGLVKEADAGETPEETKGPKQKKFEAQVEDRLDENKDGQPYTKKATYEDTADDEQDDEVDKDNPFGHTAARQYEARRQGGDDLFAVLAATEGTEEVGNYGVYPNDAAATNSNRAPTFQELNSTSQDVVSPNDPGLGQTDDLTGANQAPIGEQDHASKGTFPVHSKINKESSMGQRIASCPTCGGHGKVAVRERELPRIEDIMKVGVSGLDQIQQTVDPHDNGPKPTPLPPEVAFPWVLNPQVDIANAQQQAEEQIAQRNSLSPLQQSQSRQPATAPRRAASVTAGGRDNSGWMGDNGLKGTDYPGAQIGTYPAPSTSEGYVDPAHGQGGDTGNRPAKPFGAMEENDYTNDPDQNWQPGQPTQADQGWRETVNQNPALASAAAFVEQHRQAYLRSGR